MIGAADDRGTCQVQLITDGPALIRGAGTIRDAEGNDHPVTRPVVAVCVCGLSRSQPWCDSTHKAAQLVARSKERADLAAGPDDDQHPSPERRLRP